MTYFKSLLYNFLVVFFANHLMPGLDIIYYTKIPKIEGDLIFSFGLGFLNSLVFPIMRLLRLKSSYFKIGFFTFLISFGGYSVVNLLPLGVRVRTAEAYVFCGLAVWLCGYLTNHLEYRKYIRKKEMNDHSE